MNWILVIFTLSQSSFAMESISKEEVMKLIGGEQNLIAQQIPATFFNTMPVQSKILERKNSRFKMIVKRMGHLVCTAGVLPHEISADGKVNISRKSSIKCYVAEPGKNQVCASGGSAHQDFGGDQ